MVDLKRDPVKGHLVGIENEPAPPHEHQEFPKWVEGKLCENEAEEREAVAAALGDKPGDPTAPVVPPLEGEYRAGDDYLPSNTEGRSSGRGK